MNKFIFHLIRSNFSTFKKISNLSICSDATSELISANSITGDVTASKIIELSKKIREVTSELHKEQNKSKQYSKQISEKEDEIRVSVAIILCQCTK